MVHGLQQETRGSDVALATVVSGLRFVAQDMMACSELLARIGRLQPDNTSFLAETTPLLLGMFEDTEVLKAEFRKLSTHRGSEVAFRARVADLSERLQEQRRKAAELLSSLSQIAG